MTTPIDVIYDIEVYPNRICVTTLKKGKIKVTDKSNEILEIPIHSNKYNFIGYNNRRYDHYVLIEIQKGLRGIDIYKLSKDICSNQVNAICWNTNVIDLMEICPKGYRNGGCSLKEFGHRLKYPILQNLPYPFDKTLTNKEWDAVKRYCIHDVKITAKLWENLKEEYNARQSLKLFFDIKTEFGGAPRLAEKVILSKLGDNYISEHPVLCKQDNLKLSDKSMAFYEESFKSLALYQDEGKPAFMAEEHDINGCLTKFGVGGLHANTYSGVFHNVYDYDVSSYYPSIILKCRLGSLAFRKIYQQIYNQRLKLKESNAPGATSLKLVLNSLYGKLNDKYADKKIQAPHLALTICLLGQFYLVDLMEKLKYEQCLVANTDGLICDAPIPTSIIQEWEKRTGFTLNCTKYKTIIIKDVNSHYAITEAGEEKRKKEFLTSRWTHNIKAPIIQKAVINDLLHSIDPIDTITKETEIYNFCYFSKVKKGGKILLDDRELSDSRVRYFAANEGGVLARKTDKVTTRLIKSSPIRLAMDLHNNDIKYVNKEWYAIQAERLKKGILKNVK